MPLGNPGSTRPASAHTPPLSLGPVAPKAGPRASGAPSSPVQSSVTPDRFSGEHSENILCLRVPRHPCDALPTKRWPASARCFGVGCAQRPCPRRTAPKGRSLRDTPQPAEQGRHQHWPVMRLVRTREKAGREQCFSSAGLLPTHPQTQAHKSKHLTCPSKGTFHRESHWWSSELSRPADPGKPEGLAQLSRDTASECRTVSRMGSRDRQRTFGDNQGHPYAVWM